MNTLKESLLKGMSGVLQDGDNIAKHLADLKKEWSKLKRIKKTDFEEWNISDDSFVYRYKWMCPAVVKEYFKDFAVEKNITYVDIFVCAFVYDAQYYVEMTVCPIDNDNYGITDEETFYNSGPHTRNKSETFDMSPVLDEAIKALKQKSTHDEIIDMFNLMCKWL